MPKHQEPPISSPLLPINDNPFSIIQPPLSYCVEYSAQAVQWGLSVEDWGAESKIKGLDGVGKESQVLGFMLQPNLQNQGSYYESLPAK